MNEEQMSCQTPLDALISQDSLQIIKAAIPYMPLKSQQFLSNTISFFHHTQPELSMMSASSVQPEEILNDMRKYLSDPAKNQIDQLLFALNTIQLIQMYQENPTGGES